MFDVLRDVIKRRYGHNRRLYLQALYLQVEVGWYTPDPVEGMYAIDNYKSGDITLEEAATGKEKKISVEKRKQYKNETYWGKPITGFGDIKGKILFVGLAPAAHGGTRTGRVFTGDKSSDFLYKLN